MPRGVYDRSKGKKNKTEKAEKNETPVKTKAKVERKVRAAKTAAPASVMSADVAAQFTVLAGNISALSAARAEMDARGQLSLKIERELNACLDTLSALRKEYFGTVTEETETSSGKNGETMTTTTVPLPPAIHIPPPQV